METRDILISYFLIMIVCMIGCAQNEKETESFSYDALKEELQELSQVAHLNADQFEAIAETGRQFMQESATLQIPQSSNLDKDFIVVAAQSSIPLIADLIASRQQQGFNVLTLSVEDIEEQADTGTRHEKIRGALQDVVDPEAETYLLLLGSHNTIPFVYFEPDRAAGWEFDVYTDGYYANLHSDFDSDGDGNYGEWGQDDYDLDIDVHVGRVPLDDAEQIENYVARVIAFEESSNEARFQKSLLAGGYISEEGDTAIILSMVRELILKPAGFDVFSMLEEHSYSTNLRFLQYDRVLNEEEFTQELSDNDYGFVFWMSHGLWDGAYTKNSGVFIESEDLDHLADAPPTMYFSSACLQGWPEYKYNLAKELMDANAVSFVGSTGETYPHDLGAGSLIFMVAMNKVIVKSLPLAKGIDQSREAYVNVFWDFPYDKGMYLKNFFGFTVFGDPTLQYPDRP